MERGEALVALWLCSPSAGAESEVRATTLQTVKAWNQAINGFDPSADADWGDAQVS